MFKTAFITTVIATAAVPTSSLADEKSQHSANCIQMVIIQMDQMEVGLPAEVAAHVEYLQIHGDHYASAIRLIVEKNLEPSWGWQEDC